MSNRFFIVYALMIVTGATSVLYATEDSSRFPYLSRLPKSSLLRQKCLQCPNNSWLFTDKMQDACEQLEDNLSYQAKMGKQKQNSISRELLGLEKILSSKYIDIVLFNERRLTFEELDRSGRFHKPDRSETLQAIWDYHQSYENKKPDREYEFYWNLDYLLHLDALPEATKTEMKHDLALWKKEIEDKFAAADNIAEKSKE